MVLVVLEAKCGFGDARKDYIEREIYMASI
jgi:hypothetical protein